jgi:hypothetical protein
MSPQQIVEGFVLRWNGECKLNCGAPWNALMELPSEMAGVQGR